MSGGPKEAERPQPGAHLGPGFPVRLGNPIAQRPIGESQAKPLESLAGDALSLQPFERLRRLLQRLRVVRDDLLEEAGVAGLSVEHVGELLDGRVLDHLAGARGDARIGLQKGYGVAPRDAFGLHRPLDHGAVRDVAGPARPRVGLRVDGDDVLARGVERTRAADDAPVARQHHASRRCETFERDLALKPGDRVVEVGHVDHLPRPRVPKNLRRGFGTPERLDHVDHVLGGDGARGVDAVRDGSPGLHNLGLDEVVRLLLALGSADRSAWIIRSMAVSAASGPHPAFAFTCTRRSVAPIPRAGVHAGEDGGVDLGVAVRLGLLPLRSRRALGSASCRALSATSRSPSSSGTSTPPSL